MSGISDNEEQKHLSAAKMDICRTFPFSTKHGHARFGTVAILAV